MASFRILRDFYEQKPTRFIVVDDSEEILQIWKRVLSREEECICLLTTDPFLALRDMEIHGADILITDLMMPCLSGFELIQKAKGICPEIQTFLTTGSPSHFEETENLDEMWEVLRKPYMDIQNVQAFAHELATHHPLNRSHCKLKGHIYFWDL
ncbi:MAG: response regulator [bacterium]